MSGTNSYGSRVANFTETGPIIGGGGLVYGEGRPSGSEIPFLLDPVTPFTDPFSPLTPIPPLRQDGTEDPWVALK